MNHPEAKARLKEIVSAIRDINQMTSRDWSEKYPKIDELSRTSPLSLNVAPDVWARTVHNLQVELQLRTAEFLLATHRI